MSFSLPSGVQVGGTLSLSCFRRQETLFHIRAIYTRKNKTRLKQDANCTIYTSMSYLIRRVLAKPRLILDEMCRLYGTFASHLRRVLHKTRLIFPRINGPIVPSQMCSWVQL